MIKETFLSSNHRNVLSAALVVLVLAIAVVLGTFLMDYIASLRSSQAAAVGSALTVNEETATSTEEATTEKTEEGENEEGSILAGLFPSIANPLFSDDSSVDEAVSEGETTPTASSGSSGNTTPEVGGNLEDTEEDEDDEEKDTNSGKKKRKIFPGSNRSNGSSSGSGSSSGGSSSSSGGSSGGSTSSGGSSSGGEQPATTTPVLLADTTAPTVSIVNPANGVEVTDTITISATATDPVVDGAETSGVASVEFFIDGGSRGSIAAGNPFELTIDTNTLSNDTHAVVAKAVDGAGNTSEMQISVTVSNVVPTANPFRLGGVSLTFDDANLSQFVEAAPILDLAGQVATLYIPTGLIGTTGYMTWEQLDTLDDRGWDLGGHTVTHAELPELPQEDMEVEITESLEDLVEHDFMATEFATPFGAYDMDVLEEIAQVYNSHRNFHHIGLNKWPFNKYFLHVQRVTSETTVADVARWIDEAIASDQWLIIVFHEVLAVDDNGEYTWSTAELQELMEVMEAKGVKAETVAEMLKISENFVANSSFESGLTSWTTDNATQVVIDTTSKGSYPSPLSTAQLIGGETAAHLFSTPIDVEFMQVYGIRFFVNSVDLTGGELGFYVDEYDTEGNWISGKWLGKAGANFVIDESYSYTPTSSDVKKAALQTYFTASSTGTVFIDNVEFFAQQ